MKPLTSALLVVCVAVWVSTEVLTAAGSCESLSALKLPDTTITMAQSVAAGGFSPPTTGGGGQAAYSTLPAFCRVAATIKPTSDSDIKVEVWLPASGWNGKYQAVGNGGWAGSIAYGAMARALRDGYATSSTDTGHTGGTASFALGHPEKLIDYAYRSVHEMTVKSKAIATAFYGTDATRSYFNGCSTGGRQALVEAQRFPNDFDGIVAGAAANPKSGLDAWRIWMTQAMLKDQGELHPGREASRHPSGGARCVRRARRCQGWPYRESDALPLRPGRARVPWRRRPELSDRRAAGNRQGRHEPGEESSHRRVDLPRFRAGHRARVGAHAQRSRPVRERRRTVQVHRVQRSQVGLADVRSRAGPRRRRKSRPGHAGGRRSEPHGVRAAWRQAHHVSRLERSEHRAASERQLLQRARSRRQRLPPESPPGCVSTWCRGWATAAVEMGRTRST